MRKKWTLLLLLPALLAGCAAAGADGNGNPAETPLLQMEERVAVEAAAAPGLEAAQTEAQARPLTREEVLTAYDRAVKTCGWFELAPMSCGDENCLVDGRLYYRVDAPGFEDLDDLRAYLRDVFAPEVVERLLATGGDHPVYREVDGVLYAAPINRTRDPHRGNVQAEAVQNSDSSYSVNVSVELLGEDRTTVTGMEYSSFPYELMDGRWVFTEFRLVN